MILDMIQTQVQNKMRYLSKNTYINQCMSNQLAKTADINKKHTHQFVQKSLSKTDTHTQTPT